MLCNPHVQSYSAASRPLARFTTTVMTQSLGQTTSWKPRQPVNPVLPDVSWSTISPIKAAQSPRRLAIWHQTLRSTAARRRRPLFPRCCRDTRCLHLLGYTRPGVWRDDVLQEAHDTPTYMGPRPPCSRNVMFSLHSSVSPCSPSLGSDIRCTTHHGSLLPTSNYNVCLGTGPMLLEPFPRPFSTSYLPFHLSYFVIIGFN